jgi:broad specificity phosphatase PhoE
MRRQLEERKKVLVNVDGLRRCYNGCYEGWEWQQGDWEWLEYDVPEDKIESRLKFWRDLNDYAVSQRGESARKEFRIVEVTDEHISD